MLNINSIMGKFHGFRNSTRSRIKSYRFPLCILFGLIALYYIYSYNVWAYLNTTPFSSFEYPLEIDLPEVIAMIENKERPSVSPINKLNFPIVLDCDKKCKTSEGEDESVFVLFVIKSKLDNFAARDMIRRTWARENLVPFVATKRVFLLGVNRKDTKLQQKIALEQEANYDIVQGYFEDEYFNNTLKLMMGFQWATQHCRSASYLAFLDDDYYVGTHNLVNLLHRVPPTDVNNLIIGFVWEDAMPYRMWDSKWYTSLEEYPYRYWPPYPTAGSFFVPQETAQRIAIGMEYVKYLRYDDVFIGIIGWKLKTKLVHDRHLYAWKLKLSEDDFQKVIAMHGFKDPEELLKVWKENEVVRKQKDQWR